MLPEEDPAAALIQAVALDDGHGVFSREIAAIDMRLPSRLVFRLTEAGGGVARRAAQGAGQGAEEGVGGLMKLFRPSEQSRRPMPRRPSVVSVLDVGSTKICCLIARLTPSDAEARRCRGRTHAIEVLGIGHQRSRGIKSGVVVNLDAAEQAIRLAVDAAERHGRGHGRIRSSSTSPPGGSPARPTRRMSPSPARRWKRPTSAACWRRASGIR